MAPGIATGMARYAGRGHGPAKALLIFIALCAGFGATAYVSYQTLLVDIVDSSGTRQLPNTTFHWLLFVKLIPLSIAIAVGYTLISAWLMAGCEHMKQWAYLGAAEPWDTGTRLFLASFFPITVVCCLILYIFLGIIHRAFPFQESN